MRIVIKNGQVVNSKGVMCKNVYIDGEKFSAPFENADMEIDAQGMCVFPGVIDCSTHIWQVRDGIRTVDDFYDASRAAVTAGTTMFISVIIQGKNEMPLDCINEVKKIAAKTAGIDYSFHLQYTDINEDSLMQLPAAIKMGITSVKVFLSGGKSGFKIRDSQLLRMMELSKKMGFTLSVHAENDDFIEANEEKLIKQGKKDIRYYSLSRPVFSEVEAVGKALNYCEEAGNKIHLSHLSSEKALDKIMSYKNIAQPETCIHYLTFDDTKFNEIDAYKNVMTPPLRKPSDIEALWNGVGSGDIKIISSDHCPYMPEQKKQEYFDKIPLGVPGIEHLMPVVYSEGVAKNRISICDMVRVLCENPARIFGIPNKGRIQEGYDADFVIFNPNMVYRVNKDNIQTKCGYSLYEDMVLTGKTLMTGVRGNIVYNDGNIQVKKGSGKFIKRYIPN